MTNSELIEMNEKLKKALLDMCKYATYLGEELAILGYASYAGDFVAQNKHLLD